MLSYLAWLHNPFVAGAVAGILLALFMFVDDRYNDQETDFRDYMKMFAANAVIVTVLVFLSKRKFGMGGMMTSFGRGGAAVHPEGMYSGMPDF